MTLVGTSVLVAAAVARNSAVPAFNVITLEHAESIAAGAGPEGAILQVSENAIRFHGGDPRPLMLACRAVAEAASIPLSLHLDHVEDLALVDLALASAAEWGLGSLMFDGSRLPYAANVEATVRVAARGRFGRRLDRSRAWPHRWQGRRPRTRRAHRPRRGRRLR